MYDALYARQSVEKVDSISIESQLEYCRHEARGNPCREYIDRGYSGKNTNRPAFEQLLADVRQGKVARVIVYKLDRISRSILDFANMMQLFQQHRVEFVSSTERFDTSTPIGRAMLHICIVFAQLERETIQKRVTDAYYSRCKKGLYMGGRVPYGFARQQTVLDGVRTSMFVPVPQEARQVQLIYSLYADPANSLGDLVRYLNAHGHKQLRGGMWSTARLSEMLRNPVYVRADAAVYDFFKEQGVQILNPAADFTGYNGCYLYKGAGGEGRSPSNLSGREVVLAPHEGLVSSRDWLRCRLRCQQNRRSTTTCKAKSSWLLGKVKCGRCGYGLSVVKSDTRWQRYFVCSAALASKKQRCPGTGGTVYAQLLEAYVSQEIQRRLGLFDKLCQREEPQLDRKCNEHRIRLAEIEREIEQLLCKVSGANDILLAYINSRVGQLDEERRQLQTEAERLAHQEGTAAICNPAQLWTKASFAQKQAVADALIEIIKVADGEIEIVWKI